MIIFDCPKSQQSSSLVIPVHNEEENIRPLYDRVTRVLCDQGMSYEIIFVDDGSTDGSAERTRELCTKDPCVILIRFSRNFGHQTAIIAGIEFARGDCVITMDGDLQHPPELIPTLVKKWREGYDVVYTLREEADETHWFKRTTSRFFYGLINRLSEVSVHDGAADFRLLDRKVVDVLKSFEEHNVFLRGLVSWVGFKQIGITYKAKPRHAGMSKYSLRKMLQFASDGITSFSSLPLHLSTLMGVGIAGLSFLYGSYAIYAWLFTDRVIPGWASVLVSILFLGGVQLISIGIIGEYVSRIFNETKRRPRYIIQEVFRRDHEAQR